MKFLARLFPYGNRAYFIQTTVANVGKVFSIGLMINGRCFTFYKNCNTGKLEFAAWANIWRKTKTPLPTKDVTGID